MRRAFGLGSLPALWLLVSTAARTDPWRCLASLPGPLIALSYPLLGVWLKVLTDGVAGRDGTRVVAGLAGLLLTVTARWGVDYACTGVQATLADRVGFAFDGEVVRLMAALPGLEHHENPDVQERLELLRQSQGVLGSSLRALVQTASAVIAALGTQTVLALVHPLLLLLVLVALPAAPLAARGQRRLAAAEEASAGPSRSVRHLRSLMFSPVAGKEIRVFRTQQAIAGRYRSAVAAAARPLVRAEMRAAVVGTLQDVVFTAAFVLAVGFVLWRAGHGHGGAGDVVLAVVVCRQVQQSVVWPIASVASLGTTLRAASRLLWLRSYAAGVPRPTAPMPSLAGGIVFEQVSFRYPGTQRWVLRDFSAYIPAGATVALVGGNGAGKSTVVKLLCGFYRPTSGRILIGGADLAGLEPAAVRARFAAVFQDFVRWELTAQQAVGVGDLRRLDDRGAVVAALRAAGADGLVTLAPGVGDGAPVPSPDTQLGARWPGGVDLSGGQWQKLALARGLLRPDPLVRVLDEPTASLDPLAEHALFERYIAAGRQAGERVTVLVSHRFSTVRAADLIVVLEDGRCREIGSHDALLAAGGTYAELYTLQAAGYT